MRATATFSGAQGRLLRPKSLNPFRPSHIQLAKITSKTITVGSCLIIHRADPFAYSDGKTLIPTFGNGARGAAGNWQRGRPGIS
jgi:hypothetical protein